MLLPCRRLRRAAIGKHSEASSEKPSSWSSSGSCRVQMGVGIFAASAARVHWQLMKPMAPLLTTWPRYIAAPRWCMKGETRPNDLAAQVCWGAAVRPHGSGNLFQMNPAKLALQGAIFTVEPTVRSARRTRLARSLQALVALRAERSKVSSSVTCHDGGAGCHSARSPSGNLPPTR
jgi:hypothetical protein